MKENIFINGPINVIRLEGAINGIKKVLYVFMDFHMDVTQQTRCDDIRSKDVNTYFVENFDKISEDNIIYDFFFEQRPTWIIREKGPYKEHYIEEIDRLFNKSFMINRKKNVVNKSNNFPNIRLHYIDIRDYIAQTEMMSIKLDYLIDDIIQSENIDKQSFTNIKKVLDVITDNTKMLYSILYNENKNTLNKIKLKPSIPTSIKDLKKYTSEDFINKIRSFIDKIRNNYKHHNVKNILNNIIDGEIKKLYDDYFDNINKYQKKYYYEIIDNYLDLISSEKVYIISYIKHVYF